MNQIYQTLENSHIKLIPIEPDHREKLRESAKFDEIWTHTTLMNQYHDLTFNAWFSLAFNHSQGPSQKCFVFEKSSELIGSSRYYGIDPENSQIAIGFTWITPKYWGTRVNPSIKYLMLKNAFDNDFEKVYFHTDNQNVHSQTAIKKLGAKFTKKELRNKMRPDGTMRDTVEFVIEKSDWSQVSEKLLSRIQA